MLCNTFLHTCVNSCISFFLSINVQRHVSPNFRTKMIVNSTDPKIYYPPRPWTAFHIVRQKIIANCVQIIFPPLQGNKIGNFLSELSHTSRTIVWSHCVHDKIMEVIIKETINKTPLITLYKERERTYTIIWERVEKTFNFVSWITLFGLRVTFRKAAYTAVQLHCRRSEITKKNESLWMKLRYVSAVQTY